MSNKKKMVVAKEVHNKTQAEEMSRHKTATLNVWKINLFSVLQNRKTNRHKCRLLKRKIAV